MSVPHDEVAVVNLAEVDAQREHPRDVRVRPEPAVGARRVVVQHREDLRVLSAGGAHREGSGHRRPSEGVWNQPARYRLSS